jgi:hypothetical protein
MSDVVGSLPSALVKEVMLANASSTGGFHPTPAASGCGTPQKCLHATNEWFGYRDHSDTMNGPVSR